MAEDQVPGRPPVGAAPLVGPRLLYVVLGVLFGTTLCAANWAYAYPEKPLAPYLGERARELWYFVIIFALPGAFIGRLFQSLRSGLFFVPVYLVQLLPSAVAMAARWEGGWMLGIAGGALGAAAGAAGGWMFNRWTLPEIDNRRLPLRIILPMGFAGLCAIYNAHCWGNSWVPPADAWMIGFMWIVLAIPGTLVGRPFQGLLVMSPFVLATLVPTVASIIVGWESGWLLGIAGGFAGLAAGAATGWMFNRWIMPEYDKLRARRHAARMPGSTV